MLIHTGALKKILLLFIFLPGLKVFAQNSINGSIRDSTGAPVPFCAVALLKASDSTIVKGNIGDENGNYHFENITSGSYRLKCATVGFKPFFSKAIAVDSLTHLKMDTLVLKHDGVNLDEVSVSYIKPAVEFKKGTVMLNVENNIVAAGNTVLDLLRRIPGVIVDAQNNITVNGRSGVRFLIDGRLQQIPATQMATILSGMSADVVSTIELIKNPPARYDASGSAGLINIVLKKAKTKGFSGSLSESASQGDRFRNGNTAAFNFKSNKLSVFSNFSYYNLVLKTNRYERRTVTDANSIFEAISGGEQLSHRWFSNLNAGMDYEINKKLTLGCNISVNPSQDKGNQNSLTNADGANPFNYSYFKYTINTTQKVLSPSFNLNGTYKFDTLGTVLQMSADATDYHENFSKYTINNYFNNSDQQVALPYEAQTNMVNDFRIYTQKLDFTKPFKKSITFEAGAKSSFTKNRSNPAVQLTDTLSPARELKTDPAFSNNYVYNERILAAYATLSKNFKKVDVKAGIRTEQTLINARTNPKPFILHRDYTNFFPSASVDYKFNPKHSLQFSYSYRLDRPNYDQLNPTHIYNDQLSYGSGNPKLQPQYSHYNTLDYNYNNLVTLSVGYYRTTGFIYYYSYGNPVTKVNVDTLFNYGLRNNLVTSAFIQKQFKKISFQLYGSLMYRSFMGEVNGASANSKTLFSYGNFNVEIILPANFKLQINGFYRSKVTDGVQTYLPAGSVDVGLLRSFLDKKLDVSLSLYDMFHTQRFPYYNIVPGQSVYYNDRYDTRRIRIYAIWKFGKLSIAQNDKRSNDSEKGRLKAVN